MRKGGSLWEVGGVERPKKTLRTLLVEVVVEGRSEQRKGSSEWV